MKTLAIIMFGVMLAGCQTTIPVTKQPTGPDCVKLTVEAKGESTSYYFCDSTGTDAAARILKHLNVK
jgi:hypothetical protein